MSTADQSQSPQDLVVVGSSAGGVEALSILVSALPPDFPAPIVLAQHLDPRRPSTLHTILQRSTTLEVVVVTDATALERSKIYVVPSNRHITIKPGRVELESDYRDRPRPSVDLLLTTAAQVYGERLIAVILTGSGTDGAMGAVEVKRAGGTVIIQNPATARYPSMPLALPPTAVDHVVDLEAIGGMLQDLLTGVYVPQPEDKADSMLREILDQVNRQANIDFQPYKTSTIIRRIGRRMAATQMRSMREYLTYLQTHPQEVGQLVEAFLINVTHFFRDPEAFAYLASDVIPALIEQARSRDRVLRFWSAGCATGEEPYSLAMIVADLLGAELSEWSIKIFATDLDEAAINYARNGVYPANVLGALPDGYRERFFDRHESSQSYHITKTLRQMVVFGQQDLSRSAPFPRIDLVLCRNVLIYFTPDLQDYVLNRFAFSLQPSYGYLFLGKAETVRPGLSYYELVNKQWKVYRCTGANLPLPRLRAPGRSQLAVPPTATNAPISVGNVGADHEVAPAALPELGNLRRLNELLLRFFPVGIVVIDRSYRLISINAAARRLLGLREVGYEQDFLHAVKGIPYSQARDAIDTVFRERSAVMLPEIELDVGTERYLSLSFVLMQTDPSTPDLLAISVTDVAEQVQIRRRLEASQAEQAKLVAELETANKRLQAANKELTDANEEFQVANEELMLTHEELQATIEEFETTNEELQAANEELETNNEELQATNEELETTNDELRASTSELQIVTEVLETERVRLTAMVELAPFYIVVVHGPELVIDAIDRRYQRMLAGRSLEGRTLAEVQALLWADAGGVVELARATYYQNIVHISPRVRGTVTNERGEQVERVFVFTCVPSRDASGHVQSVVIYIADETLEQAKEREEERERLKLIFERTDQVALGLFDADTAELLIASPRYLDLIEDVHQLGRQSALGRSWQELAVFVPAEQQEQVWRQLKDERQGLELPEVRVSAARTGQMTIWRANLTPIMDHQPDTAAYVLVSAVETTEQVRAREEQERLNQLKDDFLSSASHELRTPLTTLLGYVGILGRLIEMSRTQPSREHEEKIDRVVATLERQIGRLQRLVEDLIDVGRLQEGKLTLKREPVDLAELLRQVVQDAQTLSTTHLLRFEPPSQPVVVSGDAGRLTQVLMNLIQNAITYAYEQPQIDLRLDVRQDGASEPTVAQIAVQDYGPGIPSERQEAIFSRFFQSEQPNQRSWKGLGLGLFIARQIVEQHGGTLRVASEPGRGSTFIVQLPLLAVPPSQAQAGPDGR